MGSLKIEGKSNALEFNGLSFYSICWGGVKSGVYCGFAMGAFWGGGLQQFSI